MARTSRIDATGAPVVAGSVGLLLGWLVSGIAYASGPLPDALCALVWLLVAGGIAYWLYQRMTGPYADWTDDKLVNTRLGRWIVTVAALLALVTVIRIITGIGNDDDLGLMLWGFQPL
ncbi:hypothetical protein [Solicola gregarius]|uniref:Uncharacterized protein n=1 Tax=Solicola gregarius TaxID=2908642 RepID=A0AA46YK78_9ACTN|nr:hypothetical protein [Solicola gregarius]UYM03718.1 hypothetical protein L0C25_14335 [Solicola gregarius]